MSNWHDFNGSVGYTDFTALAPVGDPYEPLPYVNEPYADVEWNRGVLDMAEAMKENRSQRIRVPRLRTS